MIPLILVPSVPGGDNRDPAQLHPSLEHGLLAYRSLETQDHHRRSLRHRFGVDFNRGFEANFVLD